MPSLFALLPQRRLRWLGHVRRMKDGRIPKDTLYGDLAIAPDPAECLSFGSEMSAKVTWRQAASTQQTGKPKPQTAVVGGLLSGQASAPVRAGEGNRRREQWEEKKERKKQMAETTAEPGAKIFKCSNCNRICGSRIGLHCHSKRCSNPD